MSQRVKKRVEDALVDLFKTVADVCDGNVRPGRGAAIIRAEYERIMAIEDVGDFYDDLVNERQREVLGP